MQAHPCHYDDNPGSVHFEQSWSIVRNSAQHVVQMLLHCARLPARVRRSCQRAGTALTARGPQSVPQCGLCHAAVVVVAQRSAISKPVSTGGRARCQLIFGQAMDIAVKTADRFVPSASGQQHAVHDAPAHAAPAAMHSPGAWRTSRGKLPCRRNTCTRCGATITLTPACREEAAHEVHKAAGRSRPGLEALSP